MSVNLSQKTPHMGTDGIFQFKEPLFLLYRGPAQIDSGFNSHILNLPGADNLLDVDPKQLVLFILHAQPQRADLPGGTAHGYDIYGIYLLLHDLTAFLSTLIIARLFVYGK